MFMSKFEGIVAVSALERRSASKYYLFLLVNVFLGSVITGTAFEQLDSFIHQPANEYAPDIAHRMISHQMSRPLECKKKMHLG